MAPVSNATPLVGLDAFVIDTETTGLDPAKARIVEIGPVPLKAGKLDRAAAAAPAGQSGRADPGGGDRHSSHRRRRGGGGPRLCRSLGRTSPRRPRALS